MIRGNGANRTVQEERTVRGSFRSGDAMQSGAVAWVEYKLIMSLVTEVGQSRVPEGGRIPQNDPKRTRP